MSFATPISGATINVREFRRVPCEVSSHCERVRVNTVVYIRTNRKAKRAKERTAKFPVISRTRLGCVCRTLIHLRVVKHDSEWDAHVLLVVLCSEGERNHSRF